MRNIFILTAIIFCNINCLWAQENKARFLVTPSVQLLNGTSKVSTSIYLKAGMRKNNHQLNLGAGIDYYQFRTLPVVLNYNYYFGKQKNKPFVYAGAGINIPWLLDNQKLQIWNWGLENTVANYKSGFTYNLGIGYAFLNKQQKGLMLHLGIDNKSLKEVYNQWVFNGTGSVLLPTTNIYQLNRLEVGIGYSF